MKASFGPKNENAKNFSHKQTSCTRTAVGILADGTLKELFSVIFFVIQKQQAMQLFLLDMANPGAEQERSAVMGITSQAERLQRL